MQKLLLLCFIGFLALTGCQTSPWDVDTSGIKQNVVYKPFYRELFAVPHDSIWQYVPIFESRYGSFFEAYNLAIIGIGGTNQLDYNLKLQHFLTDPDIFGAYTEVEKVFSNDPFLPTLNEAFKHYQYHFKGKPVPEIYTHISGFNQSIAIDSGYISISLDNYLGYNHKYYQMLRTPYYQMVNMHSQKIPSDVMLAFAITEFPFDEKNETLLSNMVFYGKMQLFVEAMLPHEPDTLKWGYSAQQLKWCKQNERQMWLYLVEQKQLFSSNRKDIARYINDGPFTSPFSQESPGRTGRWLGYRIVESYLKNHPNVTLEQLMLNNDYQAILNQSKYKP